MKKVPVILTALLLCFCLCFAAASFKAEQGAGDSGIGGARRLSAPAIGEGPIVITNENEWLAAGDKITYATNRQGEPVFRVLSDTKGVSIGASSGVIGYDENVFNGVQFSVQVIVDNTFSHPKIFTASVPFTTPAISFIDPGNIYVDGDYVVASASTHSAITFRLNGSYPGVSIDKYSGRLSVNSVTAVNNTEIGVIATARGTDSAVYAAIIKTSGFVKAFDRQQIVEKGKFADLGFKLDFSEDDTSAEFVNVSDMGGPIDSSYYSYNSTTQVVTVDRTFMSTLETGDNYIRLNTTSNGVQVRIMMCDKIISTPEELQAINTDIVSLSKYYIMSNDIDLADYCSTGGDGWNNGLGWYPVGVYKEDPNPPYVPDFSGAFTGVFDGNGYNVRNIFMNRTGDVYYSYNTGLFGCVRPGAEIKNLGLLTDNPSQYYVRGRAYVGSFVGMNTGTVTNCYSNVNAISLGNATGSFNGINHGPAKILGSVSAGTVTGGTDSFSLATVASFSGDNRGEIADSYALATAGKPFSLTDTRVDPGIVRDNTLFANEAEMKASVFERLDRSVFRIQTGQFPSLIPQSLPYYPVNVIISNKLTNIFGNQSIQLNAAAYPADGNIIDDSLTYSIVENNTGVTIGAAGLIDVGGATVTSFTVKAAAPGGAFALKQFTIYSLTQAIAISNSELTAQAGSSVTLTVSVTPANANNEVSYELAGTYYGVYIDGDQLVVPDDMPEGAQISVLVRQSEALSGVPGGVVSPAVTFTVKNAVSFENSIALLERTSIKDVFFYIGAEALAVTHNGQNVPFTSSNGRVTVGAAAINALSGGKNGVYPLIITTASERYSAAVKIGDKILYTLADLNSINDNEASLAGYYLLGGDIDLNNAVFTRIGRYNELPNGDADFSYAFTGTFDGNGFTISRFRVSANDQNVGFFGYARGAAMRNLTLNSFNVYGTSRVGSFVGSASGTLIENCNVIDGRIANVAAGTGVFNNNAQIIGGFAGSINGNSIIRYCVSSVTLGAAAESNTFNAFLGVNDSSTVIGCYTDKDMARNNDGAAPEKTRLASSAQGGTIIDGAVLTTAQMKQASSFPVLNTSIWSITDGSLPSLKQNIISLAINVTLASSGNYYVYGNSTTLSIVTNSALPKEFSLSSPVQGITINSATGVLTFDGTAVNNTEFTVVVTLGGIHQYTRVLNYQKRPAAVTITNSQTLLEKGQQVALTAAAGSGESTVFTFALVSGEATLNGNILTVSQYAAVGSEIKVRASVFGVNSADFIFTVDGEIYAPQRNAVYQKGTAVYPIIDLEGVTSIKSGGVDVAFTDNGASATLGAAFLTGKASGEYKLEITAGGKNYIADLIIADKIIRNAADLRSIDDNRDWYYILANDIDCSGIADFTPLCWDGNNFAAVPNNTTLPSMSPNYFVKQFADLVTPFTGTLNGNGYAIKNINMVYDGTDVKTNYAKGLFGYIGAGGAVQNLALDNVAVRSRNFHAIIASVNYGTIKDIYISAACSYSNQYGSAGAVICVNFGTVERVIDMSFNSGTSSVNSALTGTLNNTIKSVWNNTKVNAAGTALTGTASFLYTLNQNVNDGTFGNCAKYNAAQLATADAKYAAFEQGIWDKSTAGVVPALVKNGGAY